MRLLLGGSPCTYWSVAKHDGRENTCEGQGWELFKNYLIAKEKFKPDYFLYENVASAPKEIKQQIEKALGYPCREINSALVSAQSRKRIYVYNIPDVSLPEDKHIVVNDILDSGVNLSGVEKAYCLTATYAGATAKNTLNRHNRTMIAEQIGYVGNQPSQGCRVYSPFAKSVTLTANGGGAGAKTGLYATPATNKNTNVYEVKSHSIEIDGATYPVNLEDGLYIIRKLTIDECKRLQTVPDDYQMPCSKTQNYKMLGNAWTVDIIAHILSFIPNITTEPVTVLSMYDGMSCGQIALNKIGAHIDKYYATEIDKYAIQTTQLNFPNTIELGDAFDVRKEDWESKHFNKHIVKKNNKR